MIISTLTLDDLVQLSDVGEVVSKSIFEWFKDTRHLNFLKHLTRVGVTLDLPKQSLKGSGQLAGQSFVLTGTLHQLTRDEAHTIIRAKGGLVHKAVSKKTDYVVAGDEAGSKREKAEKLGVAIIDEKTFLKMII